METKITRFAACILSGFLLSACMGSDVGGVDGNSSPPDNGNDDGSEVNPDPDDGGSDAAILTAWIMGDGTTSLLDNGALVNVQSVTEETVNNASYARVQATGIPDYEIIITQTHLDFLDSRQRPANDFVAGTYSVTLGDIVPFGGDIGYRSFSNSSQCPQNEGYGYWPPGPECPENTGKDAYFPITPVAGTDACETGGGAIGYALNGASIYNWGDGMSDGDDVWYTLAPKAELYDVDLCGGHAANGDYHHHFYSACWAEEVGEDFTGHSEIYGYAADGYPVYGPWHDTNELAKSCWRLRDYSSEAGCDDGERSCILVDPTDVSQGVETVDQGRAFNDTYTNMSGNEFTTEVGFFMEDYYYDPECGDLGGRNLDQHNGHDHDDLGYHYHLTIDEDGVPAYPFTFGPDYKGELASNALAQCSGQGGTPPGGGGNPPPPPN